MIGWIMFTTLYLLVGAMFCLIYLGYKLPSIQESQWYTGTGFSQRMFVLPKTAGLFVFWPFIAVGMIFVSVLFSVFRH